MSAEDVVRVALCNLCPMLGLGPCAASSGWHRFHSRTATLSGWHRFCSRTAPFVHPCSAGHPCSAAASAPASRKAAVPPAASHRVPFLVCLPSAGVPACCSSGRPSARIIHASRYQEAHGSDACLRLSLAGPTSIIRTTLTRLSCMHAAKFAGCTAIAAHPQGIIALKTVPLAAGGMMAQIAVYMLSSVLSVQPLPRTLKG